ncbi:MAG: oxidoreductase [Actinobacteria bacterium]|nr:oxidoreductase [Actinomycetota bacterium]
MSKPASPYQPIPVTLEKVSQETSNIKTFWLRPAQPVPFRTGQFVELTVPGLGEAPFTPSSSPAVADRMEITIMKAGTVTDCLHSLKAGAQLGVRGPYGKGYPMDEFYGKELLILGGGVGLAPLRSLLYQIFEDLDKFPRVMLLYGAKSPTDLVYAGQLEEWAKRDKKLEVLVTVDAAANGWKGNVGVVTTLLRKIKLNLAQTSAVVCGPPIMMKFATLELVQTGLGKDRIYLSMEKNMSCGLGKCGHCRLGPYYICEDGPVFTYDKIEAIAGLWE